MNKSLTEQIAAKQVELDALVKDLQENRVLLVKQSNASDDFEKNLTKLSAKDIKDESALEARIDASVNLAKQAKMTRLRVTILQNTMQEVNSELTELNHALFEAERGEFLEKAKVAADEYTKAAAEFQAKSNNLQAIVSEAFTSGRSISGSQAMHFQNQKVYSVSFFGGRIQQNVDANTLKTQQLIEKNKNA